MNPIARARHAGFSLVEVMVGMVIGMFGIIIMMQVFQQAEAQKRATTAGGDAQSGGVIALYGIQRDIRQSGWGSSDQKIAACNITLRSGVALNILAPVTINHASIPAGDANTDTLLITYGSGGRGSPEGDGVTALPSATVYTMQTATSFVQNDRIIATPKTRPSPCNLTLDTVANTASPNVTVATGVAGIVNGTVFNLGTNPRLVAYAVRSGNLTMCDYIANDCGLASNATLSTVWVPIASNIVSLRAQYARDTNAPMDAVVDTYNQTLPAAACDIAKISAVRLAVVARSATYEKDEVTGSAPTWEGSTVVTVGSPTNPTAAAIDLTGNTEWKHYRYRVFQSVVPIRNVAWQGAVTGC